MPLERMAMSTPDEVIARIDALLANMRQFYAENGWPWPPPEERSTDVEMPEVYLRP